MLWKQAGVLGQARSPGLCTCLNHSFVVYLQNVVKSEHRLRWEIDITIEGRNQGCVPWISASFPVSYMRWAKKDYRKLF